ncbi:MAG: 50S ribosomal protein L25 [Gemmatimonadaceae bacterium]|nr:50S ribosomal protein L25 [Gemmatimonadaceae bacterium]NUO93820.1 50S ribosomal protein L25 [Gemmatimonadaceae bacterium]NUP56430.1 50S ribosomal protein L25 [Gemmatimonadaceae bacterium]NUP71220.1 50S ribosomal protein L25 [Gemmatimonadaceae bacterium]NUR34982.1 50S ribosomal protein L25 [Gemmatimonadaceae bacterium]
MASATLSAEVRNDRGKGVARKLRAAGRVPGVVYGHGREPQSLSLVARDLDKLLSSIAAGSTVIELTLGRATTKTLIREIQRHPFKKQVLHIDFMELVAGEKVIVDIPLVFVGIPEGVRLSGALLEQIVHSIEVNVDPSNIPNHIDVDVTNLAMGHSLHVRDLVLPEGLEVLTDEDTTICAVIAPRAVLEETPAAEGDAAAAVGEPELIRKAKDEDEGEK